MGGRRIQLTLRIMALVCLSIGRRCLDKPKPESNLVDVREYPRQQADIYPTA